MKKVIVAVLVMLFWCNVGVAEIKLIEEKLVKGKDYSNWISTVCIDGHKFVFMRSGGGQTGRSQSIVQAFEERDAKSFPERC